MKPLVYYCCLGLTPERQASVEASLQELRNLLEGPPLEVDCLMGPLPEDICQHIQGAVLDDRQCLDYSSCIIAIRNTRTVRMEWLPRVSGGSESPKVVICCERTHPLAGKCIKMSPMAWGTTSAGIAIIWEPGNRCALLHELLHALGAEDCYDTDNPQANPGPTCSHPQCIMQWEPKRCIVDGSLPLCENNVRRIKELFSGLR